MPATVRTFVEKRRAECNMRAESMVV